MLLAFTKFLPKKRQSSRTEISRKFNSHLFWQKFLDAGIQDVSTSISIVHDLIEKHKFSKGVMMMVMKVTNIYI